MYSLGVNSYQPIDPCCLGMPGVSGPLVDDEGFPRGDIDLYAVRQARNKYVCAQTDHIEIMRKIEQAGHWKTRKHRHSRHGSRVTKTRPWRNVGKWWKQGAHFPTLQRTGLEMRRKSFIFVLYILFLWRHWSLPKAIAAIHATTKVDVPREGPATKMEEDLPEEENENVFLQVKLTTPFAAFFAINTVP